MSTYICPSYETELIFHELYCGKGSTGNSALSLQRLFAVPEEEPSLFLSFLQMILQKKDQFPCSSPMFVYSAFTQEIFRFARELSLLAVSPSSLPERTARESELKELVTIACSFCSAELQCASNADQVIHQAVAAEYILAPYSSSELFLQQKIADLQKALPQISFCMKPGQILLRHSLSASSEIEAAAQDLIRTGATANIILCSPAVQLPILEAIFRQYGISFSCTIHKEPVKLPAAFQSLVLFALHSDPSHLVQAASHFGFSAHLPEEAFQWLETHLNKDLEYCPAGEFYAEKMAEAAGRKDDPAHRSDDVSRILHLDEICQKWLAEAAEEIQLLRSSDPETAFRNAYTLISRSPLLKRDAERKAGLNLRRQVSCLLGKIHTVQETEMMLETLTQDEMTESFFTSDYIMVTDLMHPVPARQTAYVLGCTGNAYPETPARQGLFDEAYLTQIPEYPDLVTRTQLYRNQICWIQQSGETLIYSYPANDSKGRTLIPSFELSSLSDECWVLQRCTPYQPKPHVLQPDTAFRLFTKSEGDHSFIRGSVSSVETWFQCPYHAFLSSGLYVRKKEMPALDAATIGTLQHAVMEKAMLAAGENYAFVLTEQNISAMLAPCFEALEAADPLHRDLLEFSRERLTRSLVLSAEFLQNYSRHTALKPWKPETRFDRYDVSEHVRLNGTVDRMDYDPASHHLAVIDYKSSAKSLSPGKYAEGLQLQLLSYLFSILEGSAGPDDPQLVPAAAVYFSLKEAYPSVPAAAKVNRVRFEAAETDFSRDSADAAEAYAKERSFKGWKLSAENEILDDTGILVSGKVYHPEDLRSVLTQVYEWFYDSISGRNLLHKENTAGELPCGIELQPISTACMFCENAAICRFHGEYRNPGLIAQVPKALSKGGKEKK